jgi:hypothetical protein
MSDDKIIKLNVGGRLFEINRSTILSIPDSMLGDLMKNAKSDSSSDSIFLDRNAEIFQIVLDVYRYKRLVNHEKINDAFLRAELDFYGLEDFIYNCAPQLASPHRYRQLVCVNEEQKLTSVLHPDIDESFYPMNFLAINSLMHIISELRSNPGTIKKINLSRQQLNRNIKLLLSELCHLVETTKKIVSISLGYVPRTWGKTFVIKALRNPYITEFDLTVEIDSEDAHSIVESMNGDDAALFKNKKVNIQGIRNTATKNILARRPFCIF